MAERPPQPPIPAPILTADLVIKTRYQHLRSRLYWASDTAPENESHVTVMADAIKTAFTPALPALLPDTHFFEKVECRWYGAGDSLLYANSSAAPGVGLLDAPNDGDSLSDGDGSLSEDIMPDDTALVIQKKTGLRGRANQGRLFIGGIAENVNFAGVVSDPYIPHVKTLASKVVTDINVNGSGFTTVLHARHWNRIANQMKTITKVYVVNQMGSRMDRRPKKKWERL
jgi:hypothetical protein